MRFYELLREIREEENIRQEDLAINIGYTQSAISKFESGVAPLPVEVGLLIVNYINNPRLTHAYTNELNLGLLNVEFLNNIDTNLLVVLECLIEEGSEMITAIQTLKKLFKNKRNREDISDEDWIAIAEEIKQIADVKVCMDVFLVVVSEKFGLNLRSLSREMNFKMKQKGYIKNPNERRGEYD
ncbi:MAG: helix-turn-helix transcriptional regulator [Tissierellales bacterium]|jgi:transcriptional regulator with XRE-family HTH domain|nr:helix-turn-helix transcriptional regulator [Tissierellales bacterium]